MTGWDELLSAAMVGTARREFDLSSLDIAQVDNTEGAEATLLTATALLTGYRRAGWTPTTWTGELPAPADPDDRPEASPAALQVLELLLDRGLQLEGGPDMLIRRWLTACITADQRVPAFLVVPLLRFGTANAATRDHVRTVTGPRGAWLAAHNPQWTWATESTLDLERFATAPRAERLALLTTVRRSDPARGRALVEDTWPGEQAASRAALLDALATGLGDDDEPFLEQALDDRGATVRAAAAALLDRLPNSRRAARMAGRTAALIRITKKSLDVELPEQLDQAARRDGITDRREPGHGSHVSWLIQLLGATPLSTWDTDPDHAVRRAPPEVRTGWAKAALRQRNQTWLAALARHAPAPELMAALDPETATDILAGIPKLDARFGGLLAACPGPWSAMFSVFLINRLREGKAEHILALAGPTLAAELDPSVLPDVADWLENDDRRSARRTLRGLVNALTIRRTITQEFAR